MSQTSHGSPGTPVERDEVRGRPREAHPASPQSPAWQGWIFFGATVMAMMGLFWAFLGLVALVDDEFFSFRANELLVLDSYTAWAWVHIIGGLLGVVAAVGILWGGHRSARTLGVVVAGLSGVVNFGFLAASPVWSTIMIAMDVLVVYALTVHGWEIDERR
jgi:hypothetical protein